MRYDCLVVSRDGARLWLVPAGAAWSLPHAECDPGWLPNAVGAIQHELRAQYCLDTVVLREILRDEDETSVCELEALGAGLSGAVGGRWHPASEAANALRDPAHRAALERWLADAGVETHIAAWQRPGWFEQARAWIYAAVEQAGLDVTGPVTQVKAGWNGSAVLKVPAAGGPLFCKASPRRVPGEPAVFRALSPRWSRHLPELVAADETRGWMLVREVGGEVLDPDDLPASAEAAWLYARIQIDEAADAGRWCSIGCPDRGLDTMEQEIPGLLREIPDGLANAGVVSAAEREEIASFVPPALALVRELATFAIPSRSIHHEDFRSGNVLRRPDGALVILDWNETVVAHPFFSVQRFLWFILPPDGAQRHEIGAVPGDALRRAVRDAYLKPFECFEPRPRLLDAFDVSSLLAPIYDAMRFRAGADLDRVFARGLVAEERRIARELMDHLLEVSRTAAQRAGSRTSSARPEPEMTEPVAAAGAWSGAATPSSAAGEPTS